MEQLKKALGEVVNSLVILEFVFKQLEAEHCDELSRAYPFDQDLSELVRLMMEWHESIEGR